MWKHLARTVFVCGIAAAALGALHRLGWLNTRALGQAFIAAPGEIIAAAACFVLLTVIAIARHMVALRVVGLHVPWRQVAKANLIGSGIALWLPGSMAITEGLRIAILIGGSAREQDRVAFSAQVALASVVDRLIGLFAMFALGAVSVVALSRSDAPPAASLLTLLAINLVVAIVIGGVLLVGTLPFAGRLRIAIGAGLGSHRKRGFRTALARGLDVLLASIERWRGKARAWTTSLGLSVLAAVINALTSYFSAGALGYRIDLAIILAALPMTIVAIVAPTGIAGFGGPQLLAVGAFAPLHIAPAAVVGMSLLQNLLAVSVQTLLLLPLLAKMALDWLTGSSNSPKAQH